MRGIMVLVMAVILTVSLSGCTSTGAEIWEGTGFTAKHIRIEMREMERQLERRDAELEARIIALELERK
ncbi:unnamed protein product [marine sediment metagenome]|uniref:Uncharacterized protein n=1 Tax=marine sediment metagenome TaxID=412755 RepID=X1V6J6_9ZZZZ